MTVQIEKKPWIPADKYDIKFLFKDYNLWTKFKHGEITCEICSEKVEFENLGSVFEEEISKKLKIICSNPDCIREYLQNRVDLIHK